MDRSDGQAWDREPGDGEPGGPATPGDPADTGPSGGSLAPRVIAVRRRWLFLGSGVAALTGMAVVVGGLGLPGLPPAFAFVAGMVTTATAFAAIYVGLFVE